MRVPLLTILVLCLALLGGCDAPDREQAEETSPAPSAPAAESPAPLGSGTLLYGRDCPPLLPEQEELLLEFMTLSYEGLSRLEVPDLAPLFSQEENAGASLAGISLQIGLRTLIDGVDYSLTGYRFTLTCQDASAEEDGTVLVTLREDSVQNFAQLPGVDSERGGVFHRFVLEETALGWRIRSHMQFDALYGLLMTGEAMPEDLAAAYAQAVPSYLRELEQARRALEAGRGEEGTLPAAENPYDREAALSYADQYALDRNGEWPDYTGAGGNCQNYVSQCLLAGGIPMDLSGPQVWKWYGSTPSDSEAAAGRSGSWTGVDQFVAYAGENTGFGLAAEVDAPYFSGQPGDLLEMGTAGNWRHTVIIRSLVTDGQGETVDYLVNSNTSDMRSYPASLYGYPVFALTRIAGWNA